MSTFSLFPLNVITTKLATAPPNKSSLEVIKATVQNQGMSGLFQGVGPKLLQSVLGKFLYFVWFTILTKKWKQRNGGSLSTAEQLTCGYFAEAFHLPLSIPLEVITTNMQKSSTSSKVSAVFQNVINENGLSGLWRGWKIYFFLCTQPAIQFTAFERLKTMWLKEGSTGSLSSVDAFMLGAISRAIAVLFTYPFTRVRKLLQTEKKDEKEIKKKESFLNLIKKIVMNEGFFALYKGFYPELLRGVLSSALMLMIKEKIQIKLT